ncbi:nuclear fusion protein KAR5 [Achaetomium macrosporum]|uniref:Nuclear fusion protein KAR5 n=1 Tax=Achaetomium macrosporum TaxID=79813 RepID=A0AAN7C1B3_9PEZI|nr:nuclear fusion protein KAR5 [Achaetomium macrosporum]
MQARLLVLALLVLCINGFTWGNGRSGRVATTLDKPSEMPSNSRLPNIYAVALSELQELELDPLCHRVAARLLVNNCELVDGKDEATILTDSGRKVRDFVDSYAASLAICDLERGNFAIPEECAKFREPSLSQIAIRNEPQLHVSSREIGLCLSALAASDAAWNTWVSYRHKALRFCEAARADHEKAKNILLYQRLTQVIAQLTDSVEAELQQRMNDLDNRARQSVKRLEQLTPQIGRLSEGLAKVESYLSGDLDLALRQSSKSISDGLQHANNLQQLLSILLANVLESNSQLAFAHEQSLQRVSQRVNDDMEALIAVVSTAMASSSSLQKQIQFSDKQAAVLARRQETLQHGMDRLAIATETLSEKLEDHSSMLKQANNITTDILDTLEQTVVVASSVNESFSRATTLSWWPFVIFPTAALVLGSYGLPPSILRNLALLALGGFVGFMVSSYDQLKTQLVDALEATANITASSL